MLRLLFLMLLTLNLLYPVAADLIAVYDFETRENTPTNLRKAWRTHDGKYGNALVIGNLHWGASEVDYQVGSDHAVSFVVWLKTDAQEGRLELLFYGDDLEGFTLSSRMLEIKADGTISFLASHILPFPDIGANGFGFVTEAQDILDNAWHHIAYSHYLGVHKVFVDGTVIFQEKAWVSDIAGSLFSIAIGNLRGDFVGEALLDDVGIFGMDLSDEDVRAIYNKPISHFIKALPVDPKGKTATTWGALKSK